MNNLDAAEIAALLNARNDLTRRYDANRVLEDASQYRLKRLHGLVVACVQLRPVQWYQWEVLHLSVHENYARRGLGSSLLSAAKDEARLAGVELLQCTIRSGNEQSEALFLRCGFQKVNTFLNDRSGNDVGVWQYVVWPVTNTAPG